MFVKRYGSVNSNACPFWDKIKIGQAAMIDSLVVIFMIYDNAVVS